MRVERIQETCLYAEDLAAAERFYSGVLGLQVYLKDAERHVFFRCGRQMFLVFKSTRTSLPGQSVPAHGARGPGHVAFAVRGAELDAWRVHLQVHGVPIEQDAEWAEGRGQSLYFRDPAGNSVELITPEAWGVGEEVVFG